MSTTTTATTKTTAEVERGAVIRVAGVTGQKEEEGKMERKEEKENCCGRGRDGQTSKALQEVLADLKIYGTGQGREGPGCIFSYCVRARAYTHVLARVYSTRASTYTIYMCFILLNTRFNQTPTSLQL